MELNLFTKYNFENTKPKINSERSAIIKMFVDRLNAERVGTKYKPLSPAAVSVKLAQSQVKTKEELYDFYRQCERAKNFSSYFFWSLKVK